MIKSTEGGILCPNELERILEILPITFSTVERNSSNHYPLEKEFEHAIEVYHSAAVVELSPPEGRRLYCATVTNWNFPLRPDNIMDDNLGLRCCFHPLLVSFGLSQKDDFHDHVEIDIYKYSRRER